MPQVFRRPKAPLFTRGKACVSRLLTEVSQTNRLSDPSAFGKIYGELFVEFQPAMEWALSCWEYLLSTQGCRFLPRSLDEKRYARGDYRAFTEKDFRLLVNRCFKECLIGYLEETPAIAFAEYLKSRFWSTIFKAYQEMEDPPDPNQRRLTGLSYLRCVPYQFLNTYHHERVTAMVQRLAFPEKQVVQLYTLRFYREEAVLGELEISRHAFWRRRACALRWLSENDYLSFVLLTQIERY